MFVESFNCFSMGELFNYIHHSRLKHLRSMDEGSMGVASGIWGGGLLAL